MPNDKVRSFSCYLAIWKEKYIEKKQEYKRTLDYKLISFHGKRYKKIEAKLI